MVKIHLIAGLSDCKHLRLRQFPSTLEGVAMALHTVQGKKKKKRKKEKKKKRKEKEKGKKKTGKTRKSSDTIEA